MRPLGIVRHPDKTGRISMPAEFCKVLGITNETPLEMFAEDDRIIVRKYRPTLPNCCICGIPSDTATVSIKGQRVCRSCATDIYRAVKP